MADVEQQGVEPPLSQPSSGGVTGSQSESPERKRRINNATIFLKNSKVQASPLVRRVNFLKSKGLSEEEIVEAFNKAGQQMTMDKLKKTMESSPVVSASPTASQPSASPAQVMNSQLHPSPPQQYPQQVQPAQTMMHPQHVMPMYAPPPLPPPPPPPPPKQDRWKDIFIGVTALAGVSYVVGKLVSNYSPYTVVRRGEEAIEPKSQTTAPPPQAPPLLPSEPSEREVQLGKELKEAHSEVAFLKQKVTDLETKVDLERKEKAELNMVKGRQLGQITMLSRESDKAKKLAVELKEAQSELETLRSQKTDKAGTDPESIQASINPESGVNASSSAPSSPTAEQPESTPEQ